MRRGISRYLHDRDWHSRADTILLRIEKPFDESTSGLFIGRESYRRDGALTNAKICRLFGPKRIWDPLAWTATPGGQTKLTLATAMITLQERQNLYNNGPRR